MSGRSREELETAVNRLQLGPGGFGNRYGSLSATSAKGMLLEAIDELILLRSAVKEWVCVNCRKVERNPGFCSGCGEPRISMAAMQRADQQWTISELQQRVDNLETVIREGFDLADE